MEQTPPDRVTFILKESGEEEEEEVAAAVAAVAEGAGSVGGDRGVFDAMISVGVGGGAEGRGVVVVVVLFDDAILVRNL